ncbi:MAG: hypothetical protein HZB31_08170 [Nitrospirae bacterium]|nr:hypothetical protein [Nitrospirota bacterium]
MAEPTDFVAQYAKTLGFDIRSRTIIVEGTTDVELFRLAAGLERDATGINLLGSEMAIIAAGEGEKGGTRGVNRELVTLRNLARSCLLPDGRQCYRFIGLFDNDSAGIIAVKAARNWDTSILEYKDVFRLWPVMPIAGNLDPSSLQRTFERENTNYKGLVWELEDLLPTAFFDVFLSEFPQAVSRRMLVGGKVHRDLTRDGKAHFHRFIKRNAIRDDLTEVVEVLKALRHYCGLRPPIKE